jgi:hypothetical protein
MTDELKASVARQRTALYNLLVEPMAFLARRCAAVWPDRDRVDACLQAGLRNGPHSRYLYAMDPDGTQISDTAEAAGFLRADFGRDRSQRPYMRQPIPEHGLLLSEAYISLRAQRPSLTAVQRVERDGVSLGTLGADFDLRDLPLTRALYRQPARWHQLKGDPAIRGQLFEQRRAESLMDQHMDLILSVTEELVTQSGVFHAKLHFSSSRASIWLVDDPYRYRILGFEELSDPNICLAFPHHDYPRDSVLPPEAVKPILEGFRQLRLADEVIYLRSGSLNIFNGMVSLNFSCDGSHYLPYRDFLHRESPFWRSVG